MAKRLGIAEALREAIGEEMQRDERVFCIGEDIAVPGGWGGAFTVTLGLEKRFPERMINTPIAELGFFGVACGAAMMGLRPIADVQYGDFLLLAVDQIINNIAKMRDMSGGQIAMPVVMRAPIGATGRGSQHAQSLERYFTGVPGLKVVAVSNAYDAKGILKAAVRDDNPVMIFEHKLLYGSKGARAESGAVDATSEIPDGDYVVPLDKAAVRRPGADVTVLAWLLMLHHSLQAAEQLAAEGIAAEVIDVAQPFAAGLRDHRGLGAEDRPGRRRRRRSADRVGQCGDSGGRHGAMRRVAALSRPAGGLGRRARALFAAAGKCLSTRRLANRRGRATTDAILALRRRCASATARSRAGR